MNNLTRALINQMSRRTGTPVTAEHLTILDYVHGYYRAHSVGPLYPNIRRNTGYTKADIKRLFPSSLTSVYAWVGIPIHKPDGKCKPMAHIDVEDRREVYFDHNATTYVRDELRSEFSATGFNAFGNPGSSTDLGRNAHESVQRARKSIASCLGVGHEEILFTGCGSEANNLAIKGTALKHLGRSAHLIATATEHSARR